MLNVTPRAQLHVQRVMSSFSPPRSESVSAMSDYGLGVAGGHGKGSHSASTHRESSSHAPTLSASQRRRSIMSIQRDTQSASYPSAAHPNGAFICRATAPDAEMGLFTDNPHDAAVAADDRGDVRNTHTSDDALPSGSDAVKGVSEESTRTAHHAEDSAAPEPVAEAECTSGDLCDEEGVMVDAIAHVSDAGSEAASMNEREPQDVFNSTAAPEADDHDHDHSIGDEVAPRDMASEVRLSHNVGEADVPEAAGEDADVPPACMEINGPVEPEDVPPTLHDADDGLMCETPVDEHSVAGVAAFAASDDRVRGDTAAAPIPAAIARELRNLRERARHLTEERDAMKAQLEQREASTSTSHVDIPESSAQSDASQLRVMLPAERGVSRGLSPPRTISRSGMVLTPLRGPRAAEGGSLAGSAHGSDEDAVNYYDPDEVHASVEEVEGAEAAARRRLAATQDEVFLTLLELADSSVEAQQASTLSFARGTDNATLAREGGSASSLALVAQEDVLVAIQQEMEIAELREQLAGAEDEIAKLEEANTALRLQLVLEKGSRTKKASTI